MRVTSTSMTVVSWAEVCSDSTMRVAISLRRRDIFSVVPRLADTDAGTHLAFGESSARWVLAATVLGPAVPEISRQRLHLG